MRYITLRWIKAGQGGVAVGISLELTPFITQGGITCCGRAMWICIIHPVWGRMGMAGVYGLNSGEDRAALWNNLFHSLGTSYRWIMMGDYNMTDLQNSQWGGSGSMVSGREGVRDNTSLENSLLPILSHMHRIGHLLYSSRYSWDSMRIHRHNPVS